MFKAFEEILNKIYIAYKPVENDLKNMIDNDEDYSKSISIDGVTRVEKKSCC